MLLNKFSLEGKVAIITGAGKGIGKGIALGFAQVGADVAIAARTVADIEQTANEVRKLGRKAIAIPTDIRSVEQVNNLVNSTVKEFGHIDILVNNAGGSFRASLLNLSENGWDAQIRENLKSHFLCSKAVAEVMIKQKTGGSIINISSKAGSVAAPDLAAYGVAKAGLNMLTKVSAAEWGEKGIRVNCISCGIIMTEGMLSVVPKEAQTSVAETDYLKRLGLPEDIALAAIFFASEASGFITGQILHADGGMAA